MVESEYEHKLYKYTSEIKDADAVAYAAINKNKFDFFPYKHPKLESNEIRANILYSGLCLTDSHYTRSKWGKIKYPVAPGHEIIAEVSEIGENVKDFKKGDKVGFGYLRWCCDTCKNCKIGKETLCLDNSGEEKSTFGTHFGGFSTILQQPASHFIKLPDKLKLDVSASLFCAGITVFTPIKRYLKPGMSTAVVGIGGLGHLACQFLSKLGHEVTAISTSPSKFEYYKQFGVTDIINSNNLEDLKKNNSRFDFVLNTSPSSDNFENLIELTAKGGYFIQVGAPDISEKINISLNVLVMNEISLVGSLVGSREDIKEMLNLCAEKEIYPVTEMFDFEDFPKAFDKLEHGKPIFRCIVNVGDYSKKNNLFK